jgi:hypothetical protein
MGKKLLRSLIVPLLLVLMVSTSGINLYTHACSSSGHFEASLHKVEACCDPGDACMGDNLENGCCTTGFDILKLETEYTAPSSFNPELTPVAVLPVAFFSVETCNQPAISNLHNVRPPPDDGLTGRDLLHNHSVLLI